MQRAEPDAARARERFFEAFHAHGILPDRAALPRSFVAGLQDELLAEVDADPEDEMYASDETGGRFEYDDDSDVDEPGQVLEPEVQDMASSCDFSAMAGVWVSEENSELPYEQTIVLGPKAAAGAVIGYTVFYTDSSQLCDFDLSCIPSDDYNSYRVAATLTHEKHGLPCAEGFYEFSQNAATPFHMSYSLDPSGEREFASANFVRSQWGSDQ